MTSRLLVPACAMMFVVVGVTGFLFAPDGTRVYTLVLGALLVLLSWIDLRTFTLPDTLNAIVFLTGAVMVWQVMPGLWLHHVIGALMGYGVLVSVEIVYRRLRGRDGLGRGDAKLFGALGMWTGWAGLAPILLIASISGLISILIVQLVTRKQLDSDTPIAFGPFIALGGWIVWLSGNPLTWLG